MDIPIKKTQTGTYNVAELLESNRMAPLIEHEGPYFQPPAPRPLRDVMHYAISPELDWVGGDDTKAGTRMADIEANAPILSAAASATLAHGRLFHTGSHDPARHQIHPGYYLVDVRPWWPTQCPGSPLGPWTTWGVTPHAWVTHHVYGLLRDLQYGARWTSGGLWSGLKAYDSWTCKTAVRLSEWTTAIREARAQMISGECMQDLAALELGLTEAVESWHGPDGIGRPDWYAAVHDFAFVTAWQRAWSAESLGCGPVTAGGDGTFHGVYGMSFTVRDLDTVRGLAASPIRIDESGMQLDAYRRTRRYTATADTPAVKPVRTPISYDDDSEGGNRYGWN